VVNAINKGESLRSYGQLIKEVSATAKGFLAVEFVHENRRSNSEAPVYYSLGRHVWFFCFHLKVSMWMILKNKTKTLS
jgi:hypothetical protein